MQPHYSIIIPHYNIPDLLMRCLKSIPISENIQVIVVDDNSPEADTYLKRYSELSRPYLEFIRTNKRGGAGYARNVGMDYAKGKWLIFADADDFFVEDFPEILNEYAEENADLIFFNTKGLFSNDLNQISNRNKDLLFDEYERDGDINIFRYRYTEPWGKIYSTKLIQDNDVKFDEIMVAEDYMFSVETGVYSKRLIIVNRPLYVVTVREGSLSYRGLDNKQKLIDRFCVQARVQSFLEKNGYYISDMMIFGLSVNLLRRYPLVFMSKLLWLNRLGINVRRLLWMILTERVLSPSKRKKIDLRKESYKSKT